MSKMKESLNEYPEDVIKEYDDYNAEEAWVYATTSNADEIIQKYGIEFFIDRLPRYSKIAILSWRKKNASNSV